MIIRLNGAHFQKVSALCLLLLAAFSWPAMADGTVRAGAYGLPAAAGDPYRAGNFPAVYTMAAIYDSLVQIDADGHVTPSLAQSWESESETVWVFHLRPDRRFANGARFDAVAVEAAIAYLISPAGQATIAFSEAGGLDGVEVRDPFTVAIRTAGPMPVFPRNIANLWMPEPEQFAALGAEEFAQRPVGTGPFRVSRILPGRIEMQRNPYANPSPKLDGLVIQELADPAARLQAFGAGEIDIAFGLGPDDSAIVARSGGRLVHHDVPGVLGISFILEGKPADHPLQDIRVRQALNHAVDKQAIIDALLSGATRPASQTAPPQAEGFNPDLSPYAYDPERARALLAEAGFADGFAIRIQLALGAKPNTAAIYQQVAAYLAQIGVKATIETIPVAQLSRIVFQSDFESDAFGMDYGTAPSLSALRPFRLHSCGWVAPWYCDQAVMPLLDQARKTWDDAERIELTRRLLERYRDQAPAILLHEDVMFDALSAAVRDYRVVNNIIDYDVLRLER